VFEVRIFFLPTQSMRNVPLRKMTKPFNLGHTVVAWFSKQWIGAIHRFDLEEGSGLLLCHFPFTFPALGVRSNERSKVVACMRSIREVRVERNTCRLGVAPRAERTRPPLTRSEQDLCFPWLSLQPRIPDHPRVLLCTVRSRCVFLRLGFWW